MSDDISDAFSIDLPSGAVLSAQTEAVEHRRYGTLEPFEVGHGSDGMFARFRLVESTDGLTVELTAREIRESWGKQIHFDESELFRDASRGGEEQ